MRSGRASVQEGIEREPNGGGGKGYRFAKTGQTLALTPKKKKNLSIKRGKRAATSRTWDSSRCFPQSEHSVKR